MTDRAHVDTVAIFRIIEDMTGISFGKSYPAALEAVSAYLQDAYVEIERQVRNDLPPPD